MTDAVLCVRFDTAGEYAPQQVSVPPADLEVLLADRRSPGVPMAPPKGCPQPGDLRLVGVTAWGDLTMAQLWCGLWSDDRRGLREPGPQAQQVLDRLVAQAGSPRPAVDSGSSAEEVVRGPGQRGRRLPDRRDEARTRGRDGTLTPDGP